MGNYLSLPPEEDGGVQLVEAVTPFDNLEHQDIEKLWEAFYNVAQSFAVTLEQMRSIFCDLGIKRGLTSLQSNQEIDRLFQCFAQASVADGQVVDMMEVLVALTFTARMPLEDKITLVFDCFDMSEDGQLDAGEITLSVKSTISGLCKISKHKYQSSHEDVSGVGLVDEEECETIAEDALRIIKGVSADLALSPSTSINRDEFSVFVQRNESILQIFLAYAAAEGLHDHVDLDQEISVPSRSKKQVLQMDPESGLKDDLFEGEGKGDEFMAVKPWLGAIVPPSSKVVLDATPPDSSVILDWVYGYRAQDCRNNIFYNAAGKLVYMAAAVGVVHDQENHQQQFHLGHTDDILSLDLHASSSLVATGEIGHSPKIMVWSSETMESQCVIRGFHRRGVCLLSFKSETVGPKRSTDQSELELLSSVGLDDDHSIAIYGSVDRWQTATLLSVSKGNKSKPLHMIWIPTLKGTGDATIAVGSFLVCGVKFIEFWTVLKCEEKAAARNQTQHIASKRPASTRVASSRNMPGNAETDSRTHKAFESLGKGGSGSEMAKTEFQLRKDKAVLGKLGKVQPFLCGCTLETDVVVVGAADGDLYVFSSAPNLEKTIKGHSAAVNAICRHPDGFVTGAKDGTVIFWNNKIQKTGVQILFSADPSKDISPRAFLPPGRASASESLSAFSSSCYSPNPAVRALHFHSTRKRLVVGTQASEIFEYDGTTGRPLSDGPLIQGHFKEELWGLDTHPTRQEFCTVGDDGTLRVWDMEARKQLKMGQLGSRARACCYSADGKKIAVGLGGDVGTGRMGKKDGAFLVLNEYDLSKIHEGHDAKAWISDIKFSPDGKLLALGSHDSSIWIYDVAKSYKKKKPFSKHSSYITHLDFSQDSQFLQSNCGAYELLYSDANTGKHITSASSMKDVDWSTWTCTLGWPVQGIWPEGTDGTDVNAAVRSHAGSLLATTDDFGMLNLYRYPCVRRKSQGLQMRGHSSHVTNVRWSVGDRYIITVGGNDRTILQWKHCSSSSGSVAKTDDKDAAALSERRTSLLVDSRKADNKRSHGGKEKYPTKRSKRSENCRTSLELSQETDPEFETSRLQKKGSAWQSSAKGSESLEDHAFGDVEEDDMGQLLLSLAGGGASAGDQFLAVKPWLGAIVPPSSAPAGTKFPSDAPAIEATLKWVHGYQSQSARNNLRYTSAGEIVYHAAAVGVVYNISTKSQRFFLGHDDDIVSLAVHPNLPIVATGQMGKTPRIQVWDASQPELRSLASLSGFHRRAVSLLCFSPDGKLLASVGDDDDHSIALYNWEAETLVSSSKGDVNKILDICFPLGGDATFATCGIKHIKFWTAQGQNLTCKKGTIGKVGTLQAFPTMAFLGIHAVVGTQNGELYLFGGSKLLRSVKAHSGAVYAMQAPHPSPSSSNTVALLTGGKDGAVKLWNSKLEAISTVEMKNAVSPLVSNAVRSVCQSVDGARLLVGTAGSEVYEISTKTGQNLHRTAIVQGHFADELWGLAVHPHRNEFATVGDDHTVRVWDVENMSLLRMAKMETMARACAYSPDGKHLAVGLGGRVGRGKEKKDGGLVILDAQSLQEVHHMKVSQQWISEMKYSPDGRLLAIGAHDETIHILDAERGYRKKAPFTKHSSYITHFDFSKDGKFLQSNCGAYELLYCDPHTGKHITSASAMKDMDWSTWTCTLGWPVQGIWPEGADGTDVNAAARSNKGDLLATTDDFGVLNFYRYPCVEKNSQALQKRGHSSHVTSARWTKDDRYVISLGGNDRCIMQWEISRDEADSESTSIMDALTIHDTLDSLRLDKTGISSESTDEDDAVGEIEELEFGGSGGDEFMAIKPWLGAIVPPSNPPMSNPNEPDVSLVLDWVYGYQAQNARDNAKYTATGHIAYHVAAVGVVYDQGSHTQKLLRGHDDDITCLDVSPDGRFIATGQLGAKPLLKIWDAESGELVSTTKKHHVRGISSVAFSPSGSQIITVGDDDEHSVAIWEDKGGAWINGRLVGSSKGDRLKTLFAHFTNGDSSVVAVTGGIKHIRFWSLTGANLTSKKGRFGKSTDVQAVICAARFNQTIMTGTSTGDILCWKELTISRTIVKAHSASVTAMAARGERLVTGAKDGSVSLWDGAFNRLVKFDVLPVSELNNSIRSIDLDLRCSKVLIGTQGSEIYEYDAITGIPVQEQPIVQGHNSHELWGLAMNPLKPELCTVGDDKTLRIWDFSSRRMRKLLKLPYVSRSCAYSPDGKQIAIGFGGRIGRGKEKGGGYLWVVNEEDLSVIYEGQVCKRWISETKFSPDGSLLAVGAHDSDIQILDAAEKFTKRASFTSHTSYITHFDFSADGKFLQSNCGAYELLYSDIASGKQIKSASSMKDTTWFTWTCTLGWPVQGIWPECADGTDINAVAATNSRAIVATGDDMGLVKLFRYPCTEKRARYVQGQGHSSHVTNIRFAHNMEHIDQVCLSTGGNDRAIFQWRIGTKES